MLDVNTMKNTTFSSESYKNAIRSLEEEVSVKNNALEKIIDVLENYTPDFYDNPDNAEVIEEVLGTARMGRFPDVEEVPIEELEEVVL